MQSSIHDYDGDGPTGGIPRMREVSAREEQEIPDPDAHIVKVQNPPLLSKNHRYYNGWRSRLYDIFGFLCAS